LGLPQSQPIMFSESALAQRAIHARLDELAQGRLAGPGPRMEPAADPNIAINGRFRACAERTAIG